MQEICHFVANSRNLIPAKNVIGQFAKFNFSEIKFPRNLVLAKFCPFKVNAYKVVGAMQMVQRLKKDSRIKSFLDFKKLFLNKIDSIRGDCARIAVAFDTYEDVSLKSFTREGRAGAASSTHCTFREPMEISAISLKELLSRHKTKRELPTVSWKY